MSKRGLQQATVPVSAACEALTLFLQMYGSFSLHAVEPKLCLEFRTPQSEAKSEESGVSIKENTQCRR